MISSLNTKINLQLIIFINHVVFASHDRLPVSCFVAVTPGSSTARPWVYYCRHCPETFSEEKAGGRHLREVHQAKGPLHVCNTCLHVSDSKAMHVIHQKYHSEPIVFRCKRCRYITPTRQTISTHIRYTQCREEDVELVSINSDGTEKLITPGSRKI